MEVLESENTGQVKYAGFWLRFVAYLIDDIIMSAIGFVISLPFIGTIIFSGIALSDMDKCEEKTFLGIAGIVGIVLLLTITLTMESSKQQATLGKMALGLKVTDMEGNKVSFGRATGRYFGKIISGMIMMIGYILAGLTEKKQALHDMQTNIIQFFPNSTWSAFSISAGPTYVFFSLSRGIAFPVNSITNLSFSTTSFSFSGLTTFPFSKRSLNCDCRQ